MSVLRGHLQARGYERVEGPYSESWRLRAGDGTLQVTFWPLVTRIAVAVPDGPERWSLTAARSVPEQAVLAALEAYEAALETAGEEACDG